MIELWATVVPPIHLPAVVQTVGERMAIDAMLQEIMLRAGDSQTIRWTVQEDQDAAEGPPPLFPIDPDHQFKFSIKREPTMLHELLFRTTFRAGDFDLSDIASSHVSLDVAPDDLRGALAGTYRWEFEMFKYGAFSAGSGAVDVSEGEVDVWGTGTAFTTELESGMVLDLGGNLTVVRRIYDDEHISVDPGSWPDLVGVVFQFAPRTENRTVAGGFVKVLNELSI